jgi:hypothetical protein
VPKYVSRAGLSSDKKALITAKILPFAGLMLPPSDPGETSRTVTKSTSISPHFSLSQYLSVRYICKNSLKTMRLEIVNCFVVPTPISPTSLIKAQKYLFHGIGKT